MKQIFVVTAEPRSLQGKGASRRLRREGKVPAILYGGGLSPETIAVNQNELGKRLQSEAFYSHILDIDLDGKIQQAVLKDLQRHPVRKEILHLDLLRVRADQALRMHVPLHFLNGDICPGVKTGGGVVEHHIVQVEVECLPRDLPEFIDVDLVTLEVGDAVHLSQLRLPTGVNLIELRHGNDATVAAVHLPRAAVEVEQEVVAAAEPGTETPGAAPAAEAKPEAKTEAKPEDSKGKK